MDDSYSAAVLMKALPPLRSYSERIAADFKGDFIAASAARSVEYRAEEAAFDAGWRASACGDELAGNPWLDSGKPRLAWCWADGHESSTKFRNIVGHAVNWLNKDQPVRIIRYDRMDCRRLAGRIGVITKIHRRAGFGSIVVSVPPQGRQTTTREAWFDLSNLDDIEPI